LQAAGKPAKGNPARKSTPLTPALAELLANDILAGTAELEKNAPMPISLDLSASVSGIRFEENIVKTASDGVTHTEPEESA